MNNKSFLDITSEGVIFHFLKVLQPIEELEKKISELYEWFSDIFADDAEAAVFFYRVSIDETAHADLVAYQLRVATQNSRHCKVFEALASDGGFPFVSKVRPFVNEQAVF
jgi:hypothetical protein